MGLDMYLTKEYYVKNWDHYPEDKRWNVQVTQGTDKPQLGTPPIINPAKISGITVDVAYWRKSNQIHSWFVRECQNGIDECQKTSVSVEQLQELLDVVTEVLKAGTPKKAQESLEPAGGFFFGGTDIDEYYWEDLRNTKTMLTEAIAEHERQVEAGIWVDFYYQSSW